nr:AraC family transcriptional regulator [uncultured Butyricicoccus sp.]
MRQTMERPDFECYHYLDPVPPAIDFHEHAFYEIFFFLSGDVSYVIEGRTYQLRPGDILLTDNRDIHKPDIRRGKPYERFVIWIEPDFLTRTNDMGADLTACFTDASLKQYKLIRPESSVLSHLKGICEKMLRCRDSQEFGSSTLSYIYLVEFLVYLNRAYFATSEDIRKDVTENEKINEVVSYINDHLADDLTLDRLADACYISKSHLAHQFKTYTGLTLYQFIIKKRVTVARNLIREGEPVMEACTKCGFNDYSNFLKAFKREFGRSPKEFLKRP